MKNENSVEKIAGTRNEEAIFYLNKIMALGRELENLKKECKEKTGIIVCAIETGMKIIGAKDSIQLYESIYKLGLPIQTVPRSTGGVETFVELNGYKVFEV